MGAYLSDLNKDLPVLNRLLNGLQQQITDLGNSVSKRLAVLINGVNTTVQTAVNLIAGDHIQLEDTGTGIKISTIHEVPDTRNVNTALPLTGGGALSADLSLGVNTMTGDSGSGGLRGVVPAPGAGDTAANKFLKADGTWAIAGTGIGLNGAIVKTNSYAPGSGDNGKLIVMNGSSLTLTLPNPVPSSTWFILVENINSSALTISRNSLTIDGAASNLTLQQNQGVVILNDGTNYDTERGIGFASPMTTLGDIIYEDSTPAAARLAGNTTSTKKFLRQTGTGSISAAPAWDTIVAGDLPDATTSTKGIVELANDLAGTATAPKVVGILSKAIDGSSPADGNMLQYQSSPDKWELVYVVRNLTGGCVGVPLASQTLLTYAVFLPISFPADFANSYGGIDPTNGVNPAATTTFTVKKTASGVTTTIGTISVSTSGVYTFSTTSHAAQSAGSGDWITVINENPADTNLAYPFFTLVGYLGSTAPSNPISGGGNVSGPGSSTNDDFAMFDGTTGNVLKDNSLSLSTDGTLASNSDSLIPSQKAVKTYADAIVGAPIISTSPIGYHIPAWNPSDGTSATSNGALVGSNNQVLVTQFVLPCKITIRQMVFQCTTNVGGSKTAVGIYSSDGTTKLVAADNVDTASTGIKATTVTTTTLSPGIYIFAQSSSSTSVQTTNLVTNSNLNGILNHNSTKRQGSAANSMSAGVLPSSLGAITSALVYPVMTLLEP